MKNMIKLPFFSGSPQRWFQGAGLVLLAVGLCGCPGSKPAAPGEGITPTAGAVNKIVIRGSNTIGEELAPRLIAEFTKEYPEVKFDLETKATGYGMAALRVGLCDIAAASRPAIAADLELAKDASVEMNEYVFGAYCAAVVVQASNPVTNLTRDQVRSIFTGKIQNWSEVGGPDLAVQVHIRDAISGTHLGFKELAMSNEDYAPQLKLHTNYTGIVTAVAANPGAIGFSGLTSAGKAGVKAVAIDGVLPTRQTANDGTYPIARVLRFYTNKAKESPDTKRFIEFVQSSRGQSLMAEMDFAPRP
jgi:phosphate transport system substrate-binding protein